MAVTIIVRQRATVMRSAYRILVSSYDVRIDPAFQLRQIVRHPDVRAQLAGTVTVGPFAPGFLGDVDNVRCTGAVVGDVALALRAVEVGHFRHAQLPVAVSVGLEPPPVARVVQRPGHAVVRGSGFAELTG